MAAIRNYQTVNVDYKKIKAILDKRGVTPTEASREMGHSDNYLCNTNRVPRLPMASAVMFATLNNCSLEDILMDEPRQELAKQEAPAEVPAINQETITTGVYRAIGSAIAQYGDNFRDTLVSALTEAVFQGISQGIGRYKKDLMADIRGAVFSAVYQAHQKLNGDKVGENVRSTWAKAE